jgi:hypothetical protein
MRLGNERVAQLNQEVLKGQDPIAQGAALGKSCVVIHLALKERDKKVD